MPQGNDITLPKHHYDGLIEAATSVVAVGNNLVETVLDGSPYESMLRGPVNALQAALLNVPGATTWDGIWRDTDVEMETFRHDAQPRNMPDIGVKLTHRPTGLSAESYTKHSEGANRVAAMRGLKGLVERRGREMST
jgi:hypothetical protein